MDRNRIAAVWRVVRVVGLLVGEALLSLILAIVPMAAVSKLGLVGHDFLVFYGATAVFFVLIGVFTFSASFSSALFSAEKRKGLLDLLTMIGLAFLIVVGIIWLVAVSPSWLPSVRVALAFVLGSWPQFIGAAGVLVAVLWLGFYAVRWVARGFTTQQPPGRPGALEGSKLPIQVHEPGSPPAEEGATSSYKHKPLWVLVGILCVAGPIVGASLLGGDIKGRIADVTEAEASALLALGLAYLVTYLNRRKTWPKEKWGLRRRRLQRDWVFWVVFVGTMVFLLTGLDRARHEQKPFVSSAGGFEVVGPGRPKETVETLSTPNGPAELHSVSFEPEEGFSFGVAYMYIHPSRLAEGVDSILGGVIAGMTSGPDQTLLYEKEISLEGNPGREFEYRTQKGQAARARVFVIRGRMYMLVVNGAPGKDLSDEAPRFLNSFKLVRK